MGQAPYQIREKILDLIQADRYPDGKLPAEASLAAEFGVSRNTLRDALALLERDGVILRRHGLGTVIRSARPRIRMSLTQFGSIPDGIAAAGFRSSVRDVRTGSLMGPSTAHDALRRPDAEALFSLSRLYLADDRPAIFTVNYFPAASGLADRDWSDFDGNLHSVLEEALGIEILETRMRICSTIASTEIADELELKSGAPVLQMIHMLYNVDARLITVSESYQNTDVIELTAIARREPAHP